jgi:methylglutaconyl-CoA hydratase
MVMAILRRNVSEKIAFELFTLGSEISAEQAATVGLVNRVFDDDSFDSEVEAFTRKFQRASKSAVALAKRLFYQIDGLSFIEAIECGADANVIARMTEDCKKGVARVLKKE